MLCLGLKDDSSPPLRKGRKDISGRMYVASRQWLGNGLRKANWEMKLEPAGCSQIVKGFVGPARVCLCHILEWMQPDDQIYPFKRSLATFGIWRRGREPQDRKPVWQLLQWSRWALKEWNGGGSRNERLFGGCFLLIYAGQRRHKPLSKILLLLFLFLIPPSPFSFSLWIFTKARGEVNEKALHHEVTLENHCWSK